VQNEELAIDDEEDREFVPIRRSTRFNDEEEH
jgi:hypothetical protein